MPKKTWKETAGGVLQSGGSAVISGAGAIGAAAATAAAAQLKQWRDGKPPVPALAPAGTDGAADVHKISFENTAWKVPLAEKLESLFNDNSDMTKKYKWNAETGTFTFYLYFSTNRAGGSYRLKDIMDDDDMKEAGVPFPYGVNPFTVADDDFLTNISIVPNFKSLLNQRNEPQEQEFLESHPHVVLEITCNVQNPTFQSGTLAFDSLSLDSINLRDPVDVVQATISGGMYVMVDKNTLRNVGNDASALYDTLNVQMQQKYSIGSLEEILSAKTQMESLKAIQVLKGTKYFGGYNTIKAQQGGERERYKRTINHVYIAFSCLRGKTLNDADGATKKAIDKYNECAQTFQEFLNTNAVSKDAKTDATLIITTVFDMNANEATTYEKWDQMTERRTDEKLTEDTNIISAFFMTSASKDFSTSMFDLFEQFQKVRQFVVRKGKTSGAGMYPAGDLVKDLRKINRGNE